MINNDLKKLQNGSDIRGVAVSVKGGQPANLDQDETVALTRAFLLWLCRHTGKTPENIKIAIGRDPRVSGKHLMEAVTAGLGPYGVRMLDCGLASTPAMFMSTVFPEFLCDGAVMITASHLPYNRNGFKYFCRDGGLEKKDITQIIETAIEYGGSPSPLGPPAFADDFSMIFGRKTYTAEPAELMKKYCAHMRDIICYGINNGEKPLSGMKIAVDAGNGSGGFYARDILAPLGADISGSQFLDPDGTFPNHPSNPEDKSAMEALSLAVLSSGSDLGLIFDTDVDRSAAVDDCGREISRNGIIALASAIIAEDHPGTAVVTDSVTSDHLTDFLENHLDIRHFRFRRGYRNVINKSIELNRSGTDSQLAIETSGHAAFKENYFLDDGAYLAARIVIKAAKMKQEGRTLDSLISAMDHPAESKEVRMPITAGDFSSYSDKILYETKAAIGSGRAPGMSLAKPCYEGIRIDFDEKNGNGWCLLRKSLHDPLMPLNMESDSSGGCAVISSHMHDLLRKYGSLDISGLL